VAIVPSQPKKRRVVITGLGGVTPLAPDLDQTIARIRQGRSAIAQVRRFDARGCAHTRAAEIDDFDARPFFTAPKSIKLTDRRTRFAVAAASMALQDAGLVPGSYAADRAGVVIGSSGSDLQVEDLGRALAGSDAADGHAFGRQILSGLNPLWLLVNLPNMVSAHISIQFELRGPNSTVMTDWIAGLQAIGEAASWIEQDEADLVVCGGADTGVLPMVFADYEAAVDSTSAGFGDGAAIFILEERERALSRGAGIYGELVSSAVAVTPFEENDSSLSASMRDALDRAAWRSEDVNVISPSWLPGDAFRTIERDAARAVFAHEPREIASNRDALGFALAAASPIDVALQLRRSGRDRGESAEKMMANSLGYSGQAASLCVARGAPA
jgi:3-oxoacyl-[acyl-carrier-protein] synthase II